MNAAAEKPKRGLGRGLDALFADAEARVGTPEPAPVVKTETVVVEIPVAAGNNAQRKLPVTALIPTPYQPRKKFDETELAALAESIRAHGVLQPLLVRQSPTKTGKYEIIAGERRWRASQLAQLHEVPVMVQQLDNRATLEIALIENIQRQDLTAIEEAEGYQRLMDEFGHTQEALAQIVGKSRSHLTNMMRLLSLPITVREQVNRGVLSAGHARQLVGLDNATALADEIIKGGLSVRATEKLIKKIKHPNANKLQKLGKAVIGGAEKDGDILVLEKEMSNLLGLKVDINSRDNASGQVSIGFSSLDQLDELLQKLTRAAKA